MVVINIIAEVRGGVGEYLMIWGTQNTLKMFKSYTRKDTVVILSGLRMILLTTIPKIFSNHYNNLMFWGVNVARYYINSHTMVLLEITEEARYVTITSVFSFSVLSSVCLWPFFKEVVLFPKII